MYRLLPLLFLLASCSTLRHYQYVAKDHDRNEQEKQLLAQACTETFPPTTIYAPGSETIIYKDSVIELPGETLIDTFPCPDTEYHSHIQGDKGSATVDISNGRGKITCKTDSLKKLLDSVIQLKSRVDTIKQTDSASAYLLKKTQAELQELKAKEKTIGYILRLFFKWLTRQFSFWLIIIIIGLYLTRKHWLSLIPGRSIVHKAIAWIRVFVKR